MICFLNDIHRLIRECIPVKYVTIGPRDPPYVTPLVKSLLIKRCRLRRKGRTDEADILADKINRTIQEIRSKQYNKMTQASPKELWAVVKASHSRSDDQTQYLLHIFHDFEHVNKHFACLF